MAETEKINSNITVLTGGGLGDFVRDITTKVIVYCLTGRVVVPIVTVVVLSHGVPATAVKVPITDF